MNRKNVIKVYLRIHDFICDPEEITKELLITPTKSWKKGDVIPNRNNKVLRKQSTWELISSKAPYESIENQIESLLIQVEKNKNTFRSLAKKNFGELAIAIYLYDSFNLGICLSKEILKKITDLGIGIDFDIYFLTPSSLGSSEGETSNNK